MSENNEGFQRLEPGNSILYFTKLFRQHRHPALFRFLLIFMILTSVLLLVSPQPPVAKGQEPIPAAGGTGRPVPQNPVMIQNTAVLYDQSNFITGEVINIQNFEPVYNAADSWFADDFTVPLADESWQIANVQVLGGYYGSGIGTASPVNVWIYRDNGLDRPGELVYSALNLPHTEINSPPAPGVRYVTLSIDLAPIAVLLPDDYWLSVQVNMNYQPGFDLFGASIRSVQSGKPGLWLNPGNGFTVTHNCEEWTPVSQCILSEDGTPPSGPDWGFRLHGVKSPPAELAQTGQKLCYTDQGSATECTGTGQDGEIQVGVKWPVPRFVDNSNGTITDSLTGLTWLANGNCFGEQSWQAALTTAQRFNDGIVTCPAYSGEDSDWRLPTINELESLHNAAAADGTVWLASQGFGSVTAVYWSATTRQTTPDPSTTAWTFATLSGAVNSQAKSSPAGVWLVRGSSSLPQTGQTTCYDAAGLVINCSDTGQDGDLRPGFSWSAQERFVDNGDGTITDTLTRLTWLQDTNCAQTSGASASGTLNWQQALDFIQNINDGTYSDCQAGYTDWRLANINELYSLVDFSQTSAMLPLDHPFTNLPNLPTYTSATSYATDPAQAWFLDLNNSGSIQRGGSKADLHYVWPVRGNIQTPYSIFQYPIDYDPDYPNDWYDAQNFGSFVNYDGGALFDGPHLGEDWNILPPDSSQTCIDAGAPVVAVADGTITAIERGDSSAGWGTMIVIRHDAPPDNPFLTGTGQRINTVYSLYAHLMETGQTIGNATYESSLNLPEDTAVGDTIEKGNPVGQIGNGNGQTVCHLHFALFTDEVIFNGFSTEAYEWSTITNYVDPSEFIENNDDLFHEEPVITVHPYDLDGSFELTDENGQQQLPAANKGCEEGEPDTQVGHW